MRRTLSHGTKKGGAKTHYYPLAMATYDIMVGSVGVRGGECIGEVRGE